MRKDGRALDQLRAIELIPDFTANPLGSVLCSMGNTKVLCTVCEESGVPRWLKGSGDGWVTAEYSMLPGSTDRRNDRESSRGKVGGRTMEIQRLIGRSLRAVVDLRVLGERTLWVDCDVLQADGGTRTASITGAYVSLGIACGRLLADGKIKTNPLRDVVSAISVGIVGGEAMLDLPYEEDVRADVDMNVVGTGSGDLIEVQGTGEGAVFSEKQLHELTSLALGGLVDLGKIQTAAIKAALSGSAHG
ncbi:MAG TPA: ribonuclease PH [Myxococcales bacterium]|nr:ribonuclease PH [Myxococcales bacterium]HIM02095.1 ribonuclease PH [Myxococcales bacterium]